MTASIFKLLLGLERFYNRHTSLPRGRLACSRLIGWGVRHLGMPPPILALPSGIVLEYAPSVAADVVLRDLFLTGAFEAIQTELIEELLPTGGVLFDVGANIGYFTIIGARAVGPSGRVYAFEPISEIYALLCRNVALNGLSNVDARRVACFSAAGRMGMRRPSDATKAHLEFDAHGSGETEMVTVTTVDDMVDQSGIERVDLMKVDAEGSDFEVLKGARQTITRFRPALIVELDHISRFGGSRTELMRFFELARYSVSEVRGKYSIDLLCRPC